jgi:signal transduction histidine kinase
MPEGGTLTIRTYVQEAESKEQRAESSGQEANSELKKTIMVVIEIADTGVGIPPEILPRVMEAFFTTKPEGKGTGLGLSICRRIVQGHKGTFEITSSCGIPKGTTIRIVLPTSVTSVVSHSLYEEKDNIGE